MPDAGSDELDRRAGWRVGNPWWTGAADRIEYRVSGEVTRLRTYFVDSPVTAATGRGQLRRGQRRARSRRRPRAAPPIVRRPAWNADERIVRGAPSIAARLRFSVRPPHGRLEQLHGRPVGRDRSRDSALPRARNGWDDIGYSFLIDKYGRVFEGRGGGVAGNVIGAHAGGFNTGSVGVAIIGNYNSATISSAARSALQRLLAWRLDVGHVDPRRPRGHDLGRQLALAGREIGQVARGLGPPRHQPHELPGTQDLRASSGPSPAG